MTGPLLYARSRAVPLTLTALIGTAGFAVWAAGQLDGYLDPFRRVPIVALAPLLASAVIGAGLHGDSEELDRTAVRPWWPRRLVHLGALTALAAASLTLAVLGHAETFGPPAVIRNTLGCTGFSATAAVLLGARLSWLPAFGYVSAVYLASSAARGRGVTVWAWPVQPGAQTGAWAAALSLFALGTALYAVCGARPEGPRG
ncbi:hypothetical protein LK07_11190 [Streptomyces pluripotens]|uniref:Uncharacterized protein n=1 Tax=Streptomyces pluripotens TaxID=1355015 RepID=A0A221P806_9ACTN|nr:MULTISPECIES: hypothetical protein [Streptomyces]ARP74073.1 hypothetical protein LK06_010065 [Streptomyces pluripotens]ASN28337.1 hypothetical protein LK07_11190 [Streptomyces pluripotens]KIE28100.1 hypothetical protein LK08_04965 [Streptomyces sp. MUSC 125]